MRAASVRWPRRRPLSVPQFSRSSELAERGVLVYACVRCFLPARAGASKCRPVLFSPWDKPNLSDKLLVCFDALSLLQATGILADTGTLISGDSYRRGTVKIADHIAHTVTITGTVSEKDGMTMLSGDTLTMVSK